MAPKKILTCEARVLHLVLLQHVLFRVKNVGCQELLVLAINIGQLGLTNLRGWGRNKQGAEKRWVQNSCARKSVPHEQHQPSAL